jgi:flagellar hook assembly protein FlgD
VAPAKVSALVPALEKKTRRVELTMPATEASSSLAWKEGAQYSKWSINVHQVSTRLVTIRIMDQNGTEVRALFAGVLGPGSWVFEWDGLGKDGQRMPEGPYTIEAQSGKDNARKIILLEAVATPADPTP